MARPTKAPEDRYVNVSVTLPPAVYRDLMRRAEVGERKPSTIVARALKEWFKRLDEAQRLVR